MNHIPRYKFITEFVFKIIYLLLYFGIYNKYQRSSYQIVALTFKNIEITNRIRSAAYSIQDLNEIQQKRNKYVNRVKLQKKNCHNTFITKTYKKEPRLLVVQVNVGSIFNKLSLFRSYINKVKPDIILLQEDWITDKISPFKIKNYEWFHTPRRLPTKGGGVSILVRTNCTTIIAVQQPLPPLKDITTDIISVRIYWLNRNGLLTLDVINVYRPPKNNSNCLKMNSLKSLITPPTNLNFGNNEYGCLLCGDFNAHHRAWDKNRKQDYMGIKIVDFLKENNLRVANDGSATYSTSSVTSAIDLTTYGGKILVDNWSSNNKPLGACHHNILTFDVIAVPRNKGYFAKTDNTNCKNINLSQIEWNSFDDAFQEVYDDFIQSKYPRPILFP